jgi:hypothetical protein
MVSCVPGSPIDCAAMTPTASPVVDRRTAGEVAPVADLPQTPVWPVRRSAPSGYGTSLDAGLLDGDDVESPPGSAVPRIDDALTW